MAAFDTEPPHSSGELGHWIPTVKGFETTLPRALELAIYFEFPPHDWRGTLGNGLAQSRSSELDALQLRATELFAVRVSSLPEALHQRLLERMANASTDHVRSSLVHTIVPIRNNHLVDTSPEEVTRSLRHALSLSDADLEVRYLLRHRKMGDVAHTEDLYEIALNSPEIAQFQIGEFADSLFGLQGNTQLSARRLELMQATLTKTEEYLKGERNDREELLAVSQIIEETLLVHGVAPRTEKYWALETLAQREGYVPSIVFAMLFKGEEEHRMVTQPSTPAAASLVELLFNKTSIGTATMTTHLLGAMAFFGEEKLFPAAFPIQLNRDAMEANFMYQDQIIAGLLKTREPVLHARNEHGVILPGRYVELPFYTKSKLGKFVCELLGVPFPPPRSLVDSEG